MRALQSWCCRSSSRSVLALRPRIGFRPIGGDIVITPLIHSSVQIEHAGR